MAAPVKSVIVCVETFPTVTELAVMPMCVLNALWGIVLLVLAAPAVAGTTP